MEKKPLILMVVLTIILSLLATGISVFQTYHNFKFKNLYLSLPPHEEFVISRTAVEALRSIAQARAEIHRHELRVARSDAAEAVRILRTIRDNLTTTMARNRIWIALEHLEYEPAGNVLADMPPIYDALDEIRDYFPTDKAREHVNIAGEFLKKNDRTRAENELRLADAFLVSSDVGLPLEKAGKNLADAISCLDRGDGGKADDALNLAEKNAEAVAAGLTSPLNKAKKSLKAAGDHLAAGNRPETRGYLEQARGYLEKAGREGNAEAKKLAGEMAGLEKRIESGGKIAETELRSFWERSEALAERSADYLSTDWQKAETTLGGENSLIEARLHLSYAETYQITEKNPSRAAAELGETEVYLKKAMHGKLTDKAAQEKLAKMDKTVLALKAAPGKTGPSVREDYEDIKAELNDLIRRI